MARGPDGTTCAAELDQAAEGLNRMEYELAFGLEKIIDRTLEGHRRGEPFVFGIHQALGVLYGSEAEGIRWLRGPHQAAVFGGRPPMALVTSGTQDGLMIVRRFLDAARGGFYMAPNAVDAAFAPYGDDELVFT